METYPLDIAAGQVVKWLMDDAHEGGQGLRVSATRTYLKEEIQGPGEQGLGEEEREDLTEVTAVGQLEVEPAHSADGWCLRVRIEDALCARTPEDVSVSGEPEEIELSIFHKEFIVPDQGTAFVTVDAETEQAWSAFQPLLHEMERDRHAC